MRRTLYTNCLPLLALAGAVRTNGAANGVTIDLGLNGNDFRTAWFLFVTGAITDGTHAVTLEHSVDATTWTPVPAGRVQGTLPSIGSTDDNVLFDVGYLVGAEQYVRCVVTTSGSTTGGTVSAVAVLAEGSTAPIART